MLRGHRRMGFDDLPSRNREVWESMWSDCDCQAVGDPVATEAVRFAYTSSSSPRMRTIRR